MIKTLSKTLRLAALCGATLLGWAGSAQSAYVVINADPAYGIQFPGLGWRATGGLYIPDACKNAIGFLSYFFNPLSVSLADIDPLCNTSRIQDVKLHFYNLASPGTTVELLNIGQYNADTSPRDSADDLVQELMDFSFSAGALVGFHTTLSVPRRATDLLAGGGRNCFSLEFSSDTARLVSFDYDATTDTCGTTPISESSNAAAVTWDGRAFLNQAQYLARRPVDPTVVPTVPEPGSLALALLALAGAVGVRHRARPSDRGSAG